MKTVKNGQVVSIVQAADEEFDEGDLGKAGRG